MHNIFKFNNFKSHTNNPNLLKRNDFEYLSPIFAFFVSYKLQIKDIIAVEKVEWVKTTWV